MVSGSAVSATYKPIVSRRPRYARQTVQVVVVSVCEEGGICIIVCVKCARHRRDERLIDTKIPLGEKYGWGSLTDTIIHLYIHRQHESLRRRHEREPRRFVLVENRFTLMMAWCACSSNYTVHSTHRCPAHPAVSVMRDEKRRGHQTVTQTQRYATLQCSMEGRRCNALQSNWLRQAQYMHAGDPDTSTERNTTYKL